MLEQFELFELGKEREIDEYMWYSCRLPIWDRALCLNVIQILKIWMWIHVRNLGINGIGQSCKKSKCWLLTGYRFKCDLNFGKMNADSSLRGRKWKKKSKC